jgi:hypothetical protein
MIAAVVFATWSQYVAYLVFENFRYLRFLLVTWPFVMLGMGMVAVALGRLGKPGLTLATAGVVLVLGFASWRLAAREGAFDAWQGDRRFVAAAALVGEVTPPNSAVLAMIHSGSLRYYGGRITIRYDLLDPDWLDRGVAWMNDHGVRVYALLEDWEIDPFRNRFAGARLVARIESPAMLEYQNRATIRLYDLSSPVPPDVPPPPIVVTGDAPDRWRSRPPGPTPALAFAP